MDKSHVNTIQAVTYLLSFTTAILLHNAAIGHLGQPRVLFFFFLIKWVLSPADVFILTIIRAPDTNINSNKAIQIFSFQPSL